MKQELNKHLIPLGIIFLITTIIWTIAKFSALKIIFLFSGLLFGSFFLDFDHIIFWVFLKPNIEESRLAQIALEKHDFASVLKLLEVTHKNHTSLIFHHYFAQVILALVSLFVFTSSNSTFGMAFLLALNIHLLVDEVDDFKHDPKHLQDWLFARETKQLPQKYLKHYLIVFAILIIIFLLLLIRS
ncbi:MAG TPA: hypothetical protein VF810_05265 [Patescibacteria group bacterium]